MNKELKQLSAVAALNDMFTKGRVDICCIDAVGELLGVNPKTSEAYAILRPLHCIYLEKMPKPLREAIPSLVQQCLDLDPIYNFGTVQREVITVAPTEPKAAKFFQGLLGRNS